MYKVTTRKASGRVGEPVNYDNELCAYVMFDYINQTTDIDTGEIVEELVKVSPNPFKMELEYTWIDKSKLTEISCIIQIDKNLWILCDLEVRLNVNQDEVSYVVELDTAYLQDEKQGDIKLNLNRTTVDLIQGLITSDTEDREYFNQHESEDVNQANRSYLKDINQDTNTI